MFLALFESLHSSQQAIYRAMNASAWLAGVFGHITLHAAHRHTIWVMPYFNTSIDIGKMTWPESKYLSRVSIDDCSSLMVLFISCCLYYGC